jgi:uncharacterized DUF497 family protein
MAKARFDWDERKNHENQRKHGVSFELAQLAFADTKRVIAEDLDHSHSDAVFLHWLGRARGLNGSLHIPRERHPHYWRWLLAQREKNL